MTASIRSLRSLFASTCKPSVLRLGSVANLLLAIVVACAPYAGATSTTAKFSGAYEVLGGLLTYPSGIAVDASGNVYLAMPALNAVEEIPASCISGANNSMCVITLGAGFSGPLGVAVDASGNVYVADSDNDAIKAMPSGCTSSSCVVTLGSGFKEPYGVAVDGSGNVYVADTFQSSIKMITASCVTGALALPSPTPCTASSPVITTAHFFAIPSGIAADASGNVYVADASFSTIYEIPASCIAGANNSTCVTTLGNSAAFDTPYGVAVDGSGNVFVADAGNSTVSEIPSGCFASGCVVPVGSGFDTPYGVAVDANGNVYVADTTNFAVKKFWLQGVDFGTIAVGSSTPVIHTLYFTFTHATLGAHIKAPPVVTGGAPGLDFIDALTGSCYTNGTSHPYNAGDTCTVDVNFTPLHPGERNGAVMLEGTSGYVLATAYIHGIGTAPQVNFMPGTVSELVAASSPWSAAVDGAGNLFVADAGNNMVKEILAEGGYTTVNTLAIANGHFSYPYGVAVDGAGNVFVADAGNNAVKEIVAAGGYTIVNTLGSGFNGLFGVAVDGSGNVFVADTYNSAIKEILAASGYTVVNTLAQTYTADGGFNYAEGVAVDASGNVFVADSNNNAVKEILAAGGYTTVNTLASGFNDPTDVAVDGSGNIFVADYGNNAVKEIVAAGGYATVYTLGSGFWNPTGISVDGSGNVFVADWHNNAVKKIDLADPPTLNFATTSIGFTSSDSPQTVIVVNDGNQSLNFTGLSVPTDFLLNSTGGSVCSSSTTLAADSFCTLPIDFTPQNTGALSENLTLTDNNLNAPASPGAQQSISLNSNGNPTPDSTSTTVLISPNTGLTTSASSTTTVTATVSDTSGGRGTPTGTVTFSWTCSGICSYDTTGTPGASGSLNGGSAVSLVSGTATLTGVNFSLAGTYTVTATYSGVSETFLSSSNSGQSDGNNQTTVSWTAATATAPAATSLGSVSIGSSPAKQMVTFTIQTAGSIGTPVVVTQGATGKDFTDAGDGTCTTTNGGSYGYNASETCTVDVQFAPQSPGTRMGAVLLEDTSGNLLATAYIYGLSTGPQVSFAPATQSTLAPLYNGGTPSTGFNYPTSVAMDGAGNVFVADTSNSMVKEITYASSYTTVNTLAPSYTGGTASTSFHDPYGIAIDGAGNIFVADTNHAMVKEITAASGYTTVNTLAGSYVWPSGLAVDNSGNVYVSDNGSVYKITAASNYTSVTTLYSGFGTAYGIAVDGSRNVFVAESNDNDVKEILAAESYTTAHTLATAFGSFHSPMDLAVDAGGNVYVTSYWGYAVYVISAAGGYSTVTQLSSATPGAFGVALDATGNLFISSSGNIVSKLDVTDAPSLSFDETAIGFSSTDSPQTVTVINQGNASLSISALSYATDFPQDNSNSGVCTTGALPAGSTCTLPIDFTPLGSYPYSTQLLSENVSLTDNTLNVPSTGQSISLSGTATPPTISFSLPASTTLTSGTVGVSYSVSFTATGGAGPYSYSSGTLPAGLSLSSAGTLSGYPTAVASSYSITVTATDKNNFTGQQTFYLTIGQGTATINITPYSVTYNASAHTATGTATGYNSVDLSAGLTLSGTTHTSAGTYNGDAWSFHDPAGNYADSSGAVNDAIGQATASISVSGYTVTFDGSPHTASGTATGVSSVNLSGDLDLSGTTHTSAGTYSSDAWSFSDPTGNYASTGGTVSDIITMVPATASSPAATSIGSVNIGSSTTQMVIFTLQTAGAIGMPVVVTQGATGLDFTDAGDGTCTTTNGSSNGYSALATCTVDVKFMPKYPGQRYGAVLLEDTLGNILATAYVSGTGTGPQLAFLPGVQSALGTGLNQPYGIAVDSSGNVFVADHTNNAVKRIPSGCTTSGCISTIGGGFSGPYGIALDGAGNVLVTDFGNNAVKEIPNGCTASSCVITLGGAVNEPTGIAVDGSGNVFAGSGIDNTVNEIPSGCMLSSCMSTIGGGFSHPYGIAVDGGGNVYVADFSHHAVKMIPSGCTTSSCVNILGGAVSAPYGVAVDASGNVFVGDYGSSSVKEIPNGCTQSSCMSAVSGTFVYPIGVALSGNGNIYVSDAAQTTLAVLDLVDAPSLSFNTTAVGFTSTDSPQAVTALNDGNASLVFSGLSYPTDFPQDNSNAGVCTSSTTLAASASCTLPIDFTPTTNTLFNESLSLTDNSLNVPSTQQQISLSGLGITPTITFSSPSSTTLTDGTVGVHYRVHFRATGGTNPYSYSITAGTLPPGLTLSSDGVLWGKPTTVESSYSITVTATDANSFTGQQTFYLTIGQGTATVTLTPSSLTQTYNGSPLSAAASTDPTGLLVNFTYTGTGVTTYATSSTAPTNAGSYTVVGTISDTNYTGTNSGTLTIDQATASINITPYSVTYNANPHTAIGTATGVNSVDLSSGLNLTHTTHTNAGSYTADYWTFHDTSGNYADQGPTTITDTISQATASINVTPYNVNFDGNPHSATGSATGSGSVNLSSDLDLSGTTHTNAGSYTSDPWSFTDLTGNYASASSTVSDTINMLPATATAPAATSFSSTILGGWTTQTVTFTIQTAGAIGAPVVVTQGATGMDFTDVLDGNCSTSNGNNNGYSANATCTVDVRFRPRYPGQRMGAVLLEDTSGNILATAYIYGTGTGPQINFSPFVQITLGGGFSTPQGVAADGSGNVYISDSTANQVQEFPLYCADSSCVNPLGGGFSQPHGAAVDGAGNIYVADYANHAVKEIPTSCIAGANDYTCVITRGGGFHYPEGVAVDGAGNIYVADSGNNAVKQIPSGCSDSSCVTALGGSFAFDWPRGVAVDGAGNVYVADTNNGAVEEMSPGCALSSCVTTLGGGFSQPDGVAVDNNGNVYVADAALWSILRMPASCATSSCVTNLNGNFASPYSVALDQRGNVFVADPGRSAVNELNFAGAPSLSFNTTAVGFTSTDSPQTVTVTNEGNVSLRFSRLSIPTDFPLASSGDGVCTGTTTLLANTSCTLPINFTPTVTTSLNERLTLTDNSLLLNPADVGTLNGPQPLANPGSASQSILLTGTGIAPTITFTLPASTTLSAGTVGVSYSGASFQATGGTSPYSYSGTVPSGLTLSNSGALSGTPTTAVTSYSITVTATDANNFTGQQTFYLTIGQGTATVTLGSLAQSYNGSTHSATATTNPSGLTVNFTYTGIGGTVYGPTSIPPTAVGSYTVTGTINDLNYTGSNSGTLVISKGTATVTLGNLAQIYNGSALSPTATTVPAGLVVSFTYNGSQTPPTNVGSYPVLGTVVDDNYDGSSSGTLVISKATAVVTLGNLAQTYTGSALSATATTNPTGLTVNFTYNSSSTAPTLVGNYAVVGTISDTNYSGTSGGTLVISKATATVTLGNLAQTYTGSALSATATTNPTGLTVNFTYNGSSTSPTAVGNYAVVGTINDTNYSGTNSGTLVISKATATVTLGSLAQTYTGSALSATATTNPTGLTVNFTYTGIGGTVYGPTSIPPTAVGSYTVTGTINDTNYSGTNGGTLVISKATATVTLGNLAQTYNGSALSATATTNPTGLTVNFTYNSSSTPPTAVGNYAVVGTISDTNYSGSNSGTLVISKATATVTLGSLAQTYTGSALSATATTNPTGLTVNFTYNSSSTPPTAVGNYAVVGTISDTNYSGTSSGTLVISKATATVTLGSLAQTYTGSALSATATTNPTGLTVNFTYNSSSTPPTAVGNYAVVGTISDTNYSGTSGGTLVISKATATVTLGNLAQTYNGSALSATATTNPTGLTVNFTYNGSSTSPTAVGNYAVVGTISDTNYSGSNSGMLVISKATATVTLGSLAQTYTGSALSATATTNPTGLTVNFTYNSSSNPPTAVGNYAVVGTISDTNYSGSNSGMLVISKATATVTLGSLAQTYTGSALPATATTNPTGLTVNFTYNSSSTPPTAVGNYAVVGTISDINYSGTNSGTLVIAKATATVTLGNLAQAYNGSELSATATTNPTGLTVNFTYTGTGGTTYGPSSTPPTLAGSYAVVGTISDTNYSGTSSGTLVISKATATVTLGSLAQTYTGSALSATATTNPTGLTVNLTYNGSSNAPILAGNYAVVGTISDTNYSGTSSGTLVISKATASVTLGSLGQTYTGSALSATATTNPTGLTVNFTYNGSSTSPTAAANYAVVGTISDANYTGTNSGMLVIAKATATVTLGNLAQTYNGSELSATATTNPTGLTVNFTYNSSSTPPTAVGNYAVVGTISDINYSGTNSGTLVISKSTATVTLGNLAQTYTGSALSATAITNPTGLTVNFTYNGSSTAPTAVGNYAVVGTISDTNYSGSNSGTLVIAQAASQVASLASNLNPSAPGSSVKFTATVSSTAGMPTGTVNFLDNTSTLLGQGTLVDGVATLTTSFTDAQAGSNSITAVYSGDNNFLGSSSSALAENVVVFTLTPGSGSVTSQTVSSGGVATYELSVAPASGTSFPAAVTLSISGMPAGATATITPSTWTQLTSTSWSFPANTALSTITLSIQVPATTTMLERNGPAGFKLPPVLWGVLLLPFAGKLRRSGKRMRRAISLMLLLAACVAAGTALGGCGGSSSSSGSTTQPSDYTITVTATSGTVSSSTTLTLVVN
ncbi:MAG: MBG domain-containing protein [Terracidiphilus sp.]